MSPNAWRKWLPHPVLSVLLAASWLLLQQTLTLPHLMAAAALGLVIPRLISSFLGLRVKVRSPRTVVTLVLVVLWDIVVSNATVARIVLNPWSRPHPAWVRVSLDIRQPNAVALLATIITTTPGTLSCIVDDVRAVIWVHALDCSDPAALVAQIKHRYEHPLKEIFE